MDQVPPQQCPSDSPPSERAWFDDFEPFDDRDLYHEELNELPDATFPDVQFSQAGHSSSADLPNPLSTLQAVLQSSGPSFVAEIQGNTTDLAPSFVKLEMIDRGQTIHKYDVSFVPEVGDESRRALLLSMHLQNPLEKESLKIYDMKHTLWRPIRTNRQVSCSAYEMDGKQYWIWLRWECECKITDHDCRFTIMNTIVNEIMSTSSSTASDNSEDWPVSAFPSQDSDGRIRLELDLSYCVLTTTTVNSILAKLRTRANGDASRFKADCSKYLIGMSVMVEYTKSITRIDDIDFESNPLGIKMCHNGQKISCKEYYEKQYNVDIQDLRQPMLVHNRQKLCPVAKESVDILQYFLPEFCYPHHYTDDARTNCYIMKELAEITQLTPRKKNSDSAIRFRRNVNAPGGYCRKLLRDWGLRLVGSQG